MIQQDKKDMKVRRKHRHTGLKVFLVILIILLLAAGRSWIRVYAPGLVSLRSRML